MVDMLSQDEIDALLGGGSNKGSDSAKTVSSKDKDEFIKLFEKSIQKSSEILANLVNKKVTITYDSDDNESAISSLMGNEKFILTEYDYKNGLKGSGSILIKDEDAKVVANLMMGSEEKEEEISDLQLSALTEAVSQMIGGATTTLSGALGEKIDINSPKSEKVASMSDIEKSIDLNEGLLVITYNFIIDDEVTSDFYLIFPNSLIEQVISKQNNSVKEKAQTEQPNKQTANQTNNAVNMANTEKTNNAVAQNNVNVKPVQFSDIHSTMTQKQKENIDLIMDVPLEVTVELGRTHKSIKEILEFAPGTIIELDKLAGEPIDILVNGKFVAKGEVIVIDENFGIRITEIIDVKERL